MVSKIRIAIKDGLPSFMQDELEDQPEDYSSFNYEDWCDLLSTIDVKDESKRAAAQINKIDFSRSASLSDINKFVRIPRKNNPRNGVLRSKTKSVQAPRYTAILRALQ